MTWTVDDTGIRWEHGMESGFTLAFTATEIRRERTGTHAVVSIFQDLHSVGYDTFNTGRDKDRGHLANAAHSRMGDGLIDKKRLAYMLDDFCLQIWPKWSQRFRPEELAPDPDHIEPVRFMLEPYIIEAGGTIMFAAPGSGKSYLALLMAQSINAGIGEVWPVSHRRALYVNLERSRQSMERRLALVNQLLGLPLETPLRMLNARGRTLSSVAETIGDEFDVLFLDSLSRSGAGSLSADDRMNETMDKLNVLADTWFLVAHAPRQDATHVFGSIMQDAAADLMVRVTSQEKEDGTLGVGLQAIKGNDVRKRPMSVYAMTFDDYGLNDFREALEGEFPDVESEKKMGIGDQLYYHLVNVGDMDAGAAAKELGLQRNKVSSIFANDERFTRTGTDGRKVLYGVIDRHHG